MENFAAWIQMAAIIAVVIVAVKAIKRMAKKNKLKRRQEELETEMKIKKAQWYLEWAAMKEVEGREGIRSLIVPRQNDDGLTLEIYKDGVLYGTLSIGEEIRNSGYSWEDEDLRDIYLTISLFSSSGISVDVNGWDAVRVQYTI